MKGIAYDGYYKILNDDHFKDSDFHGPVLTSGVDTLTFRWDAYLSNGDTLSIYVHVPSYGYHDADVSSKSQTGKLDSWELLGK
jgi:hypothetical protein